MRSPGQQFYYKNNRLQQLRGFCYTAQFGSITRAARHMGLSQPNVSLQIKALENDFGVKLFKQKGRSLILTREGKILLELALPPVNGIQQLHREFQREQRSAGKIDLHIGVNGTVKNYIMPPIVSEYLSTDPEINFTLHYAEHSEIMDLLQMEEIDCAVLPRREHMPFPKTCLYTPVFFYTPSLITRRDHPLAGRANLSIEDISGYELALPSEELRVIPNLYNIFSQFNALKKPRVNFVKAETGREYIESGYVITIGSPCYLKENDILVATPLPHLFPMVDYGLVVRAGQLTHDKIKKLLGIMQHQAFLKQWNLIVLRFAAGLRSV